MDNGQITTSAEHATGGNINIETFRLIYLQGSRIETSVHGGSGDGGNITIENPRFVVLNNSEIHAHAEKGNGGNIQIKSEQFISSVNSSINASSKLGLDGEVQIDSPAVDMDAMLIVLQGQQLEAKVKTCNVIEELDNPSYSLRVKKRDRTYPLMK
jgi:large exoprotein involved in heme utilization and adhesion